MKRKILWTTITTLLLLLSAFIPVLADGPTVATDKADYVPYETVTITGSGFEAEQWLDIVVIAPDGSVYNGDGDYTPGWDTIQARPDGTFTYYYRLNYYGEGMYTVEVFDAADTAHTTVLASTTFTDAVQARHNQWRNDAEKWTNGNVNGSNSTYAEGDSLPYRYEIKGLELASGEKIYLEINYSFFRSDAYAFDFLTSYDRTTSPPQFSDALTSLTTDDCDFSALTIPDDTTHSFDDQLVTAEGTQYFAICHDGDSMTASIYEGPVLNHTSAEDEKIITIEIDTNASEIALFWGGHFAKTTDWEPLDGYKGAGFISGSPFHMRGDGWIDEDGDAERDPGETTFGPGDRSVQTGAVVVPGSITIIKEANPESSQEFDFIADSALNDGNFTLVDDGTSANTIVFEDLIDFRNYDVTEDVPPSWILTSIVCDDPDEGTTTSGVTATIDLDEGENVVCTFYNAKVDIDIQKTPDEQVVPTGSDVSFTIEVENTGEVDLDNVNLTDAQCDTLSGPSGDTGDDGIMNPDETWTYLCTVENVTEGFTNVASVTADDPDDNQVTDSDDADVEVFELGSITIIKEARKKAHEWVFFGDLGEFPLGSGGSITFPDLVPGTYAVLEDRTSFPSGPWTLTSVTCVDQENQPVEVVLDLDNLRADIPLLSGQHVTCTFLNERADVEEDTHQYQIFLPIVFH